VAAKTNKTTTKKSAPTSAAANVTRIKAADTAPAKKKSVTAKKVKTSKKPITKKPAPKFLRPFILLGEYFKGAWFELRQVRWPNRRATWSLTGAVLAFTAFFVVLVVLLDVLFKFLFEQILK
jgi:preprotein translocase subunit SecE